MHEGHHYHEHSGSGNSPEMRKALLEYLLGHNRSHARELDDLVGKLEASGERKAADAVREGAACFARGNEALALALSLLGDR